MTSVVAREPISSATHIEQRIGALDWPRVTAHLDAHGWATIEGVLAAEQCEAIAGLYDDDSRFRSHVVVSEVRSGHRHTVGVIFHDAT